MEQIDALERLGDVDDLGGRERRLRRLRVALLGRPRGPVGEERLYLLGGGAGNDDHSARGVVLEGWLGRVDVWKVDAVAEHRPPHRIELRWGLLSDDLRADVVADRRRPPDRGDHGAPMRVRSSMRVGSADGGSITGVLTASTTGTEIPMSVPGSVLSG